MTKVIIGVVFILVIAYIVTNPSESAHLVHSGWGHAKDIVRGLGDFVNKVAG